MAGQSGRGGVYGDEVAYQRRAGRVETQRRRVGGRFDQRLVEHRHDVVGVGVRGAVPPGVDVDQYRVGIRGVVEDTGRQPVRVVRAQDAQDAAREGDVDQRFVLDAGRVLLGGPAGPDGLADDPYRTAGVLLQERVQHPGDDLSRVATGARHVD